jgi:mannobiose 2-epimerase
MELFGLIQPSWKQMTTDLALSAISGGWNGKYLNSLSIDESYNHIWWVSSEAMVGLWNLYLKTKDRQYLLYMEKLFVSIQEDLVDPNPEGEWFWSKEIPNGSKMPRGMGELWKTPYHNVRAFLKLMQRM